MNTAISCNGEYLYIQVSDNELEVYERGDQSSWEKVQNFEDEEGNYKQFQNPIQFSFNITQLQAHSSISYLLFVGGQQGNLSVLDIQNNEKTAIETLANQDIKILRHYSRIINEEKQLLLVSCDSIGKIRIFKEKHEDDQQQFDLIYNENMNAEIKDIEQRSIQRDSNQYIDILILTEQSIQYQITSQKAIQFYQWNQDNQDNQQTRDTLHYYKEQDYLAVQHQDELQLFNFIDDKRNNLNKQKIEFSEKSGVKYIQLQNQPQVVYFTPDCHSLKILNLNDQTVLTQELDDELFDLQIISNQIIACSYKKLIWIFMKDQQIEEQQQETQHDSKQTQNNYYQKIQNNYKIQGGTLSNLDYQIEVANYNLLSLQNNIALIYSDNFIKTIQFYQAQGQITNSAQMVMLSQVQSNKSLSEQFFLENELTPGLTNNISIVQSGQSEFQAMYNVVKFNGQIQKQNTQIVQVPHDIEHLSVQAKSKSYSVLAYGNGSFSLYDLSQNNNPTLSSSFELDEDIYIHATKLQGNYIIASTDKDILKLTQQGKTYTKCPINSNDAQDIDFYQIEIVNQYILMIDRISSKIYYIDNRNFEKYTEIGDCNQLINKANNDKFKSIQSCQDYNNIEIESFKAIYTLENTLCCAITFRGFNISNQKYGHLPYVLCFQLQQEDILIMKESRLFFFDNIDQRFQLQVQLDVLSNMSVQIDQYLYVLQGLFSPYTISHISTFFINKNEIIVGLQGVILVNYSISNQRSQIRLKNVFNCTETTLQKQIIYSTFTKYVTNKQITQALQLLQNADPSVYDTIASLCIKMNQTQLLSNCVSKLQNLQLNQLIRADPQTNVSQIISNAQYDYIVDTQAQNLQNAGIRRKQIIKAIGERCYLLGDIQGYEICQEELNYKINQESDNIENLMDKFQEIMEQQSEQEVIEEASQMNTKKSYYAAAKCLEITGNYVQAARFYELSNSDDSAIRSAIESQDNSLLYQIASKSNNKTAIRTAARHFINLGDDDSINKSLLLYTQAGCHLQAIDLCMQQKLYQNLCDVIRQAIESNAEISKAKLTDIASYLLGADVSQLPLDIQRYIQQTSIYLYSYAGEITTALSQINKFDVKITEQIANELQPENINSEENRKITSTIAALCYKSGLYSLACKKYLSINDLQHSLQCLCKLNDPEKVIKFTIRSKNRNCLIAAANWLANQNSQQYAPQITVFYQKAKAWEELSSWYLQRAYDICREDQGGGKQYQKALEQLEVCQNQLNGVNVGNERSEQFALIQKKINLNRKLLSGFLQIQEFAKNNITTEASEIVEMNTKKLISIINDSDVEVMIEVVDVLNWMVQFYKSRGETQKAKDLQAKIQNLSNNYQQQIQDDVQINLDGSQQQQMQQQYQPQNQQQIQQQQYQQQQYQQQQQIPQQYQQQQQQYNQNIQQQEIPQQQSQQQVIEGFPTSQSMVQQANQVTLALNNDEDLNIEL